MEIVFTILGIISFLSSIFIFILYKKEKGIHKKTQNSLDILNASFNSLKDDLLDNHRSGYYEGSTTLLSIEDKEKGKKGELYKVSIFVKELDKYTNGKSKIKYISSEVIDGYDPAKYNWVKSVMKDKFSSIKDSKDIIWLESEESLVRQRTEKIKNIMERINSEKDIK